MTSKVNIFYPNQNMLLCHNLLFRCSAFSYDKPSKQCKMFVISPYSFRKYLSSETSRLDAIYVKKYLYG